MTKANAGGEARAPAFARPKTTGPGGRKSKKRLGRRRRTGVLTQRKRTRSGRRTRPGTGQRAGPKSQTKAILPGRAYFKGVLCYFKADRPPICFCSLNDRHDVSALRPDRLVAQQQEQARHAPRWLEWLEGQDEVICSAVSNAPSLKSVCTFGLRCPCAVETHGTQRSHDLPLWRRRRIKSSMPRPTQHLSASDKQSA